MKNNKCKFDQEDSCAVLTIKQILEKETAINLVYHDKDDHGWQFLSTINFTDDDARVVSLKNIIELDISICDISHIKPGYHAIKENGKWYVHETK